MGLDTRAFRRATREWKQAWVERVNATGQRAAFRGLPTFKLEEPVTVEDAPEWHQDNLDELDWPGGLVGGMMSGVGNGPSFRGKDYHAYVQAVTGKSLYDACDDMWQGGELREVTLLLEAAAEGTIWLTIASGPPKYDFEQIDADERKALARWFRLCVEHDLAVAGDY